MECSTPSVVDQFDVKLQKSQRNFFTLAELLAGQGLVVTKSDKEPSA